MWMNRLDIWITIIQNFVEFRLLKVELLLRQSSSSRAHLDWSVRKVCVCGLLGKNGWHRAMEPWIEKLKSSAIAFSFTWCFLFFLMTLSFVILAWVAANHKTATESDVLNKIAGVRSWQNWCWGRRKMIIMNENEYFNTCKFGPHYENGPHYGTTIQFCSNLPHKYTTLISTIKLARK